MAQAKDCYALKACMKEILNDLDKLNAYPFCSLDKWI